MTSVSVQPPGSGPRREFVLHSRTGVVREGNGDGPVVGGVYGLPGCWKFWRQWQPTRKPRPLFASRRDALLALAVEVVR